MAASSSSMDQSEANLLRIALISANDRSSPWFIRDLVPKDLTHLNSGTMTQVLGSLLSACDPTFEERANNRTGRLRSFERFGILNNFTFDNTPNLIFKTGRKFFPADDDTFDMSIILRPQDDPKRAKHVITYLVAFLLLVDPVSERFGMEYEALNEENVEKNALYGEIEDLRNATAETAIHLQAAKDSKPQMEAEVLEAEGSLRKLMSQASNLEEECKLAKRNYEKKAKVKNQLEARIAQVDQEKAHLEDQLVRSPQELDQLFENGRKDLVEEDRRRGLLGNEIKAIDRRAQRLLKLIPRMNNAVAKFEDLITNFANAREKHGLMQEASENYALKRREFEELRKMLEQAEREQENLQQNLNKRLGEYDQQIVALAKHVVSNELEREEVRFKIDETLSKLEDMESSLAADENVVQELEERLSENDIFLSTFTQKCKDRLLELHELLNGFLNNYQSAYLEEQKRRYRQQ